MKCLAEPNTIQHPKEEHRKVILPETRPIPTVIIAARQDFASMVRDRSARSSSAIEPFFCRDARHPVRSAWLNSCSSPSSEDLRV